METCDNAIGFKVGPIIIKVENYDSTTKCVKLLLKTIKYPSGLCVLSDSIGNIRIFDGDEEWHSPYRVKTPKMDKRCWRKRVDEYRDCFNIED